MSSTTVQSVKKTLIAAVAALGIGAAIVGPSTPAFAQTFHGGHGGGGWHGGAGGWHGGATAWRGGGNWRGGNWRGGSTAWRGGGWHNRGYGYGYGWGPAVGFGVAGLAAGAVFEGPYGDGCLTYQAVYDAYGRYAGQREVYIC
jgi:hypothetical protein